MARSKSIAGGKAVARFEGTAEVIANLDKYEKRIFNKELQPAFMAAAELVRDDAAKRAPVGPTGRLREGMVAEWQSRRRRAVVGPSKDAYYGEFQERGTSRHAAQPFLRPALDSQASAAFRVIAQGLSKAADAVAVRRGG